MITVDELKEPLIVGETYLVPCIREVHNNPNGEWYEDSFGELLLDSREHETFNPIINHPHSDKETGQNYVHYHGDDRFVSDGNFRHIFRYNVNVWGEPNIVYKPMKCIKQIIGTALGPTKPKTFKHKCIYKNKCPHRGYDLSSTPVINGVITCPLHGLKFNALTKNLIMYDDLSQNELALK